MKPDWDKLMTEFAGNAKIIVGDVDCTAEGKPLCDTNGVKGFPTIKHGDVANLEDYSGGRDFASLKKFAEGLKPLCSPSNMDLCEDDQKAEIEKLMALSDEDIAAQIKAGTDKLAEAEATFSAELEKLQASYKKLQETKEKAEEEVKASGLGMLKAVQAAKKAAPAKEEL
jgi:hypothetical protein